MDHLDDRRETVRRARRRGQQPVHARLVEVIVDAHHDVEGLVVLHRRGDDDLLDAAFVVRSEQLGRAELARALEDQIRTPPIDLAGRRVSAERDRAAIDHELVAIAGGPAGVGRHGADVDRVEREEMRRDLGASHDLVDRDELDVGPLPRCT